MNGRPLAGDSAEADGDRMRSGGYVGQFSFRLGPAGSCDFSTIFLTADGRTDGQKTKVNYIKQCLTIFDDCEVVDDLNDYDNLYQPE